ncbi:GNAT family N-acetyltransferase [Salinisphaera sp. Q1T1-3]|uniref:GNAT family N-acetyltransferase n=1 Tax=Salinisphaera sp. Q1T1-3 TaxID=2321229 RepID=UPI000E73FB02|nr:GNAT family N-acetyltransferase [Salinisphaera sp. Q1T1-3]RJS91419.1 GNAT family N-acetyltransferase [Salinisphaera sp. Q1T1-3]
MPAERNERSDGQHEPRLPVALAPVTPDNWQAVIALRLEAAQAANLASNLYSLAEAYVVPACRPMAIVAGRTVVGFVMYEYLPEQRICSIPRFMIDHAWQGRGYGRAGLAATLVHIRQAYPQAAIVISLLPGNDAARQLYAALGFIDTGEYRYGELIMRYD